MRAWIAATAAAVLLVGCGTAAAKPVTARPRAQTAAASAVPLRARALALAWRLVDELSPPPGTRTVHLAKLPPPLNQPQAPLQRGWVRVTETLEAPADPESVWEAMLARIAATAEAAWRPARTAAEHLDPASFRSVTISAQPWQSRVMTRTFASQADIAGLTSIINAGAPAPLSVVTGMRCAPVAIVYVLRFTPRAAGGPSVVLTLGGCPHSYGITVNGRQQPSLWDNGKLRTAAGTLLAIRYPLGA